MLVGCQYVDCEILRVKKCFQRIRDFGDIPEDESWFQRHRAEAVSRDAAWIAGIVGAGHNGYASSKLAQAVTEFL